MNITHHDIETNGVRLHVAACGPQDGELVVLLHGFPEYWGAWKRLMGPLAEAGYRVVAPDQRGYNTSDKPASVADYRIDELVADIAGLIEALGHTSARVVGHDWGGTVCWHLARQRPERVHQAVVLNCVPAEVLQRAILSSPRQLLRSGHALVMQVPFLPQWWLALRNFKDFTNTMVRTSRPGTFGETTLQEHHDAWSRPGARVAMVRWYQAATRFPALDVGTRVTVPSLLLWGELDPFLGVDLVDTTEALCDDIKVVRLPTATHWLHHEETEHVLAELTAFFAQ